MKLEHNKIVVLTAYDATFASVIDAAGVDVILVGDSLGMVIQGHDTTLPVSLDDMVYHCRCVSSGSQRSLLIADLPFMTYATPEKAADHSARLIQQGGVQMVKLEGCASRVEVIRFLIQQNIPVCGHLGLTPQSIHHLGSYSVQCRDESSAATLIHEAQLLRDAGVTLLILECVPRQLAKTVTEQLDIPVVGIGAGPDCDGQVLVLYDMLGLNSQTRPRFVKNFLIESDSIDSAIRNYVQAVRQGRFPAPEHCY